jgi:hypothetical protein
LGRSSIVLVKVHHVAEMVFREGNHSLRVMRHGLSLDWLEGRVWLAFQPYSAEMTSVEDYRRSYFYMAGQSCSWRVEGPGDTPPSHEAG